MYSSILFWFGVSVYHFCTCLQHRQVWDKINLHLWDPEKKIALQVQDNVTVRYCMSDLEISLSQMVIANGKILIRSNYKHAGLIVLQWFQINSTQHSYVCCSPTPLLRIRTSIQRIIDDVTRIEITKLFSSSSIWMYTRFPAKFLKAKRKDAQMGNTSV